MGVSPEEREQLEKAIAALESQRDVLGDAIVDSAVEPLRKRLQEGSDAASGATRLEGERKLVTVMFADLSGFTALSEALDPEQVRGIVNRCFNALVPIVEHYGGTVDKFIGDEIMALFGAPSAHENDAERALRAALDMREALAALNATDGTSLGMHIGVNSGTVVTGGLGSDGREQYSVIGDTVNLAARLAAAAPGGEILVGPTTRRLTSLLFDFTVLPPMAVKGKAEPVVVARLEDARPDAGRMRGVAGLVSPLVGRDRELALLIGEVHRLHSGSGGVVAITGDPGLGQEPPGGGDPAAHGDRGEMDRRTSSVLHGEHEFLDGAQSALRLPRSGAGRGSRGRRRGAARVAETTVRGRGARGHLPVSGPTLRPGARHACQPGRAVAGGPARGHAARVHPAGVGALRRATPGPRLGGPALGRPVLPRPAGHTRRPHRRSAAAAASGVPSSGGGGTRVVPAHAPEAADATGLRTRTIDLAPLTESDSCCLVENLLRVENLPAVARNMILRKAEGNPFFLEELLRSLIDSGLLLVEDDRVIATRTIEDVDVPDTVQGVIAARIDRLPTDDKRTLQTAAVIGRVFQEVVLAWLVERQGVCEDLSGHLAELQRHELCVGATTWSSSSSTPSRRM